MQYALVLQNVQYSSDMLHEICVDKRAYVESYYNSRWETGWQLNCSAEESIVIFVPGDQSGSC